MHTQDIDELDVGDIEPAEDPQLALDGRTSRRRRRFSQGIEQRPSLPSTLHVGRFSEGIEARSRPAATRRVGSFADGVAWHPEQPWERRVGSFADGVRSADVIVRQRDGRRLAVQQPSA